MAKVARETERTYSISAGQDVPDLSTVDGVASVVDRGSVTLDAVYHDTAGLTLAAAGITLRRRTGGSDAGWHLKLPAGRDTREELRLPPRPGHAVPLSLARLVRARTRGAPLVPVVRLHTTRHTTALLDDAGRPLAELVLDHVQAHTLDVADPDSPRRWTEIEVELTGPGTVALLDAVEAVLAGAGIRRGPSPSKLARALGPRVPRPARPRRGGVGRPTAGDVVLEHLRVQARTLVELDVAVRRDQPDAVHRTRIACRRARGALRSFRTVLDPEATRWLAEELRWLGGELGPERDREVLTERLRAGLVGLDRGELLGPARGRLRTWSGRRRATTRRQVLAALDSHRHRELLNAFDALLATPPLLPAAARPAPGVLVDCVLRDYRRLARRARLASTDADRHEVRKAAKRTRYSAEAATAVLGEPARAFAGRMKEIQQVLGEYQDTLVTRQALREIADQAQRAGEHTFTFGVLHERAARAGEAALAGFGPVWREASDRRHRVALAG